jgi:hypothetical protein
MAEKSESGQPDLGVACEVMPVPRQNGWPVVFVDEEKGNKKQGHGLRS